MYITLHLLRLSFSSHLIDHLVKLLRSSCKPVLSVSDPMTFQIFTSSANIRMLLLIQSGISFTDSEKSNGPNMET